MEHIVEDLATFIEMIIRDEVRRCYLCHNISRRMDCGYCSGLGWVGNDRVPCRPPKEFNDH